MRALSIFHLAEFIPWIHIPNRFRPFNCWMKLDIGDVGGQLFRATPRPDAFQIRRARFQRSSSALVGDCYLREISRASLALKLRAALHFGRCQVRIKSMRTLRGVFVFGSQAASYAFPCPPHGLLARMRFSKAGAPESRHNSFCLRCSKV